MARLRHVLPIAAAAFAACGPVRAQSFDASGITAAVSQTAQAASGELAKSTIVNKTVMEGVAAFRSSYRMQTRAVELEGVLAQPQGICQTMGSQDVLNRAGDAGRARIAASPGRAGATSAASAGKSAVQSVEEQHQASSSQFCAIEEENLGVCSVSKQPELANFAGADQDALYLFQGAAGGASYDGKSQVKAADAYIQRVVVGVPTQRLRMNSKAYATNPQARAYVELERRYRAFLSMSDYSLRQIKESRTPSRDQ